MRMSFAKTFCLNIARWRRVGLRIVKLRHAFGNPIGNALEDLLGLSENNLPIPNAAEWELKLQRLNSTSLTTYGSQAGEKEEEDTCF